MQPVRINKLKIALVVLIGSPPEANPIDQILKSAIPWQALIVAMAPNELPED